MLKHIIARLVSVFLFAAFAVGTSPAHAESNAEFYTRRAAMAADYQSANPYVRATAWFKAVLADPTRAKLRTAIVIHSAALAAAPSAASTDPAAAKLIHAYNAAIAAQLADDAANAAVEVADVDAETITAITTAAEVDAEETPEMRASNEKFVRDHWAKPESDRDYRQTEEYKRATDQQKADIDANIDQLRNLRARAEEAREAVREAREAAAREAAARALGAEAAAREAAAREAAAREARERAGREHAGVERGGRREASNAGRGAAMGERNANRR